MIRESRYFIALLSNNSITKRGYFQKEIKFAFEILDEFSQADIFIIPVRIDDCKPVEEKLENLHWADMTNSYEEGLYQILRAISDNKMRIKVPYKKDGKKSDEILIFFSLLVGFIIGCIFLIFKYIGVK